MFIVGIIFCIEIDLFFELGVDVLGEFLILKLILLVMRFFWLLLVVIIVWGRIGVLGVGIFNFFFFVLVDRCLVIVDFFFVFFGKFLNIMFDVFGEVDLNGGG